MRSAGDVDSSIVSDQMVAERTNETTKCLTRGGELLEAQVDVPSSV
jgi:hypothetical protein